MRRSTSAFLVALSLIAAMLAGVPPTLAQGTVYTDSMDSEQTGLLSTQSSDPSISFAYQNSQFVVNVQQPSYRGDIISTLKVPELASSRLTVDALISGDPANKYVIAGCRHTGAGEGYFFGYLPATGDIIIWRRDATGDTNIAQSVEPSLIASPNTTYQIGIDCWTNVITGIVNGQPVLSAFDPTYATGRPAIGVGANGQETDGLMVSFDNLTVEDKGNLALGPETSAALETPAVYTDTMDSPQTGLLSTETFDPTVSFAYQNSQFVVNAQQPAYQGDIISELSVPELANSRLLVDALIGGNPANKYVIAGCRHTETGEGYFFGYLPAIGYIVIWRRDAAGDTNLAESADPSLTAPANTMYQIGIECQENTITGSVNGQPMLSASDGTYKTGRPTIGVGANGQETDGLTVAFDNLQVVDYGNLPSSLVTPVVPKTPAVLETPATLEAAPTVAAPTVAAPTVAAPTVAAPTVAAPTVAAPVMQTVPMTDPNVDPSATLSEAFTVSLNLPPLVSGFGEDVEVSLSNIYQLPAGVQVADFYTELYFTTPSVPAGTSYLVGFCFWTDPAGECYDIFIEDDGTGVSRWGYGYDTNDGAYESLQTGEMPPGSLDPTPGATNFLGLTVYQGVAILSSNTFEADVVIPLAGTPLAGDVQAEAGFLDVNQSGVTEPIQISISDFAVWDLSSGMAPLLDETGAVVTEPAAVVENPTTDPTTAIGPVLPPMQSATGLETTFEQTRTAAMLNAPLVAGLAGTFTEVADVYSFTNGAVTIGDFYTIATFNNPIDTATSFDVGMGFRAPAGSDSGLRFVVNSSGEWYLLVPNGALVDSGETVNFDVAPGAANTIEVLAQGGAALIVLNGTVLKQVDLSSALAPGDVYVGEGFFQGDTVVGRQVPWSNFWVYPLAA